MAMDQQPRVAYRWGLVAQSGYCGHRLTPRAGEPTWVTEAFLVDPADAGQGVVDARVEIGTRDLLLASLSAERPRAVMQPPVLLDEEFCFYVTPQRGDSNSDDDDDSDIDASDGVAVYFRGFVFPLASRDTEGEEEEDEGTVSSEDDDDKENKEEESEGKDAKDDEGVMCSDDEGTAASTDDEDKGNGGEVGGRAATASGVGGNVLPRHRNIVPEAEGRSLGAPAPRFAVRTEAEHVPPVAAAAFSGIFAIVYLLTFLILLVMF